MWCWLKNSETVSKVPFVWKTLHFISVYSLRLCRSTYNHHLHHSHKTKTHVSQNHTKISGTTNGEIFDVKAGSHSTCFYLRCNFNNLYLKFFHDVIVFSNIIFSTIHNFPTFLIGRSMHLAVLLLALIIVTASPVNDIVSSWIFVIYIIAIQ